MLLDLQNIRSDLSETERQEYVTAVKCLMKLPPKSDKTRFPGAMSRYDDFVAYHMTHAMQLHDNIHLFGAHKYFVHLYEQALRTECGYTGYQPVCSLADDLLVRNSHVADNMLLTICSI